MSFWQFLDRNVKSSFASWQRSLSALLSALLIINLSLIDMVLAAPFEVKLNETRSSSPQDLKEFGLVTVIVEDLLMRDGAVGTAIRSYCDRVQKAIGAVCMISSWKGETASRIVEALHQMYFEGLEVSGGMAKLIGLVLIGDVPVPVVRNGQEMFPSLYPYTDLVKPAYRFDSDQGFFLKTSEPKPRPELWHGLLRPSGNIEERKTSLITFFQKNEAYYKGELLFKDSIGFHDQFWENASLDQEALRWYDQKMQSLDRLMNYRYSGAWLNELSGDSVKRLKKLTSQKFEGVEKPSNEQANKELGFDQAGAAQAANAASGQVSKSNPDINNYGEKRLKESIPDQFSPGPIRNLLKDYVHAVQRYISGTSEILSQMGRRQPYETLPSLITKLDKFSSQVLHEANLDFEAYFDEQGKILQLPFELVSAYEKLQEFAAPPKLEYEMVKTIRLVNGIPIESIKNVEQCSLERGSSLETDLEEGRVVTFNRKDNPLTAQDIAGVSGRKAKEEIQKKFKHVGYCSYTVKAQCNPRASQVPVFDYAASEIVTTPYDFRSCLDHDGPQIPKDPKAFMNVMNVSFGSGAKDLATPDTIERASFFEIPSFAVHKEPTGETVAKMFEKKMAHYYPLDAVRHMSYFVGGGSKKSEKSVARVPYPNTFTLKVSNPKIIEKSIDDYIRSQEKALRKTRVESNWKRFFRYLAISSTVAGKSDFWNYDEVPEVDGNSKAYQDEVLKLLRFELDPEKKKEDFEVVEAYLDGKSVSPETEKKIEELLKRFFPTSLAKENLQLRCQYSYKIPPLSVKVEIPKISPEDLMAFEVPQFTLPNVNPPSMKRTCSNQIAKNTVDEVKTLRAFYFSRGGVKVDIALLHKPEGFIEKMDPKAVALVLLGPVPIAPPVPHPTYLEKGIEILDAQVKKLETGPQPKTVFSKVVKPVPLKGAYELQGLQAKHLEKMKEAVRWLNLSIEEKHREALHLLAKGKAMTYLVLDGSPEHLSFTLPGLQPSFKLEDETGALSGAVLEQVKKGEEEIQKKMEEKAKKRDLQNKSTGDKKSKCGDTAPLLKWPGAVLCWLDETVKGPIFVPVDNTKSDSKKSSGGASNSSESSPSGSEGSATNSAQTFTGQLLITPSIIRKEGKAIAKLDIPKELDASFEASGSVQVVQQGNLEAAVIAVGPGKGTVIGKYLENGKTITRSVQVTVTDLFTVVRPLSTKELKIGTSESLSYDVEVHDEQGLRTDINTTVRVIPEDDGVIVPPESIAIDKGKGRFTLLPGKKARTSNFRVGSEKVSASDQVPVTVIGGDPAVVRFEGGDKVIGMDNKLSVELLVTDQFGNLFKEGALRATLSWDTGMKVNGKEESPDSFVFTGGRLRLHLEFSDELMMNKGEVKNLPRLSFEKIDEYPDITVPQPLDLDSRNFYRLKLLKFPPTVIVGRPMELQFQVDSDDSPLMLNNKILEVQTEIQGAVERFRVPFQGLSARLPMNAPAQAGTLKLSVQDPDFGTVTADIEVLGDLLAGVAVSKISYEQGTVSFEVQGKDQYGNPSSLKKRLGLVTMIGSNGQELMTKNFRVLDEVWKQELTLPTSPDRVLLRVGVEGLPLEEKILSSSLTMNLDRLKQLSLETPYLVLLGSAFGDIRAKNTVAQSILFSDRTDVQAITTEITPHRDYETLASIFPTGRVQISDEIQARVILENLQPTMVLVDQNTELGRLRLKTKDLPFEIINKPVKDFVWTAAKGAGKSLLVLENSRFEESTLLTTNGTRLLSIDQQGNIVFEEASLEMGVEDDGGPYLLLTFSHRNQDMARWYIHFQEKAVAIKTPGKLSFELSQKNASVIFQPFFAGESTNGPQGLKLSRFGEKVRKTIGAGRTGFDDISENNGQGFFGDDKTALNFFAGNTVGESTLLQSEGIANFGDPVISIRQAKLIPLDGTGEQPEFSIGQLLYAPESGTIEKLLRLDTEGDQDDDLVMVLREGNGAVLKFLEGHGEGKAWGDVSDLLRFPQHVKDIKVLNKKDLVILFDSGQILLEKNLGGRFEEKILSFPFLGTPSMVSTFEVADFDKDQRDDLLLLTGKRELWILYSDAQGTFGSGEKDRQKLETIPIRLEDPKNLKSGLWIYTKKTPNPVVCKEDKLKCQSQFFKPFEGVRDEAREDDESIDRLAELEKQSQVKPTEDKGSEQESQDFLVRVDKAEDYAGTVSVQLEKGTGNELNILKPLPLIVTITPERTESPYVLRFDLGQDFRLASQVQCQGCDEELSIGSTSEYLFSLEGKVRSGKKIELRLTVEYVQFPEFSFQIMHTNNDAYPDIGINLPENRSASITVFESQGARKYLETLFGQPPAQSSSAQTKELQELQSIMSGNIPPGMSAAQIKEKLLKAQKDMQSKSSTMLDESHQDGNKDGYPDLYQEVMKSVSPSGKEKKISSMTGKVIHFESGKALPFPSLISKVFAQAPQGQGEQVDQFNSGAYDNLQNIDSQLQNVAGGVQRLVDALKCSRGCLPLPINFAFLTPGPINIFGTPAGFDLGVPMFGLSPAPFFIWPPLVPYQATQFRVYLSPTLTMGLGMSLCLGPWLVGQCMAFSIPLPAIKDSEKLCDAAKEGLRNLMQGVQSVAGVVQNGIQTAASQISSTGVLKAKADPSPTSNDELSQVIGVGLGGGVSRRGVVKGEAKVFLDPVPKVFVDWWDRQWEEIINSLTDLPSITVRVPDPTADAGNAPGYFDKLEKKFDRASNTLNLAQIYDLIDSLPFLDIHPNILTIQIPWIEPAILRKIERSLTDFLFGFLIEFIEFLRSFNLPCNITVSKENLFVKLKQQIATGNTESEQAELRGLRKKLSEQGKDLQAAQFELDAFLEKKGWHAISEPERGQFLSDLKKKQETVAANEKKFDEIEEKINDLKTPGEIKDIIPLLFGSEEKRTTGEGDGLVQQTAAFWKEQLEDFSKASSLDSEAATAIRSCTALKFGLDTTVGVSDFIKSIQKNLEALEAWKKFPRELAKYLNIVEHYIQELARMIDQLTSTVLKWWREFERKLDLWIDVVFSFEELIALVKMLIDILKGYEKKCGLCTSDRLTLKEIIMKILFGVIPKFPIVNFPDWPDIRLDFSNIQFGSAIALPVFDVRTIDIKWPKIQRPKLPRFSDFKISATGDVSAGFSLNLPKLPLVIPEPPLLPALPALPNIPKINLPNLPPAPTVPKVLESFLPLMKIIQTVLNIWCLVNKALIPVDEKTVKTQIENLTNRSSQLILPLDVLLNLDLVPGDLLKDVIPFDLIDVRTKAKASVNIDPLPGIQTTIDQQFNQPMQNLVNLIDSWTREMKNIIQQGLGNLKGPLQNLVDQSKLEFKTQEEVKVKQKIDLGIPEDFDVQRPPRPSLVPFHDMMKDRMDKVTASHESLKQSLQAYSDKLAKLPKENPDELLSAIKPSGGTGNLLALGEENLLWRELLQQEKRSAAEKQMVEKSVPLVQKEKFIAEAQQKKQELTALTESLVGSGDLSQLGTVMVRNGTARRIQDYPLEDPAVLVWDNDIFLAYENALYVKSFENGPRRTHEYRGNILKKDLREFQRSAVHFLSAATVSGDASAATQQVRWSWDSQKNIELTLWDSTDKTQKIDQQHRRYFVTLEEEAGVEQFESLNPEINLIESETFEVKSPLSLRFGADRVKLSKGLQFSVTDLSLREMIVSGSGRISLENRSGQPWKITLDEGVELELSGLINGRAEGPADLEIPEFIQRPFILRSGPEQELNLKKRSEVLKGEEIPEGSFSALSVSILLHEETGLRIDLPTGLVFSVTEKGWKLKSGRGQIQREDIFEKQIIQPGMVIFDDESISGELAIQEGSDQWKLSPGQEVSWKTVSEPSLELKLPAKPFYGRIREREGRRGFSEIVLGGSSPLLLPRGDAVMASSDEEVLEIPIFTPLTLDSANYLISDLPSDSFYWQVEGDETLYTGSVFRFPGFDKLGEYRIRLFVRSGEEEILSKEIVLRVIIPKIRIDEKVFTEGRTLQISTEPPVSNFPIGIVGERDGVKDWVLEKVDLGTKDGDRYRTTEDGIVQLAPFPMLEGWNIVIEDGLKVARLYPNSRVVLLPEFEERCKNEKILDSDSYLKYRVSCKEGESFVKKFEVRMVPDLDTDAQVVSEFTTFDRGVTVKLLQGSLQAQGISVESEFAPGGIRILNQESSMMFVVNADGGINLMDKEIRAREKAFENPMDPLIWELVKEETPLLELQIKGPSETAIVDAKDRVALLGDLDNDGMLDAWEKAYGVDHPAEDPDLDDLPNLEEFKAGTSPKHPDTDNDGLLDGEEFEPLQTGSTVKKVVFHDVQQGTPSGDAIYNLTRLGFIKGYPDGSFKPDQSVTRAEALKILMSVIRCENCERASEKTRAEFDPSLQKIEEFLNFHPGSFEGEDPLKKFSFDLLQLQGKLPEIGSYFDVKVSDWYYYCIEIATKLGLVHGYRGIENGKNALGKFIPDRNVNIAELMKMVIQAIGKKGKESDRVFGPAGAWWNDSSNNYLATAEEDLKLLEKAEEYLDPLRSATRAQVAFAAHQILKTQEEFDFDNDQVKNSSDECPCQAENALLNGCPAPAPETLRNLSKEVDKNLLGLESLTRGRAGEGARSKPSGFSGIEIAQSLRCRCLALLLADLIKNSKFFAVITGKGENALSVYEKSNTVTENQ